jgi:phenylacetate-CoA ligase
MQEREAMQSYLNKLNRAILSHGYFFGFQKTQYCQEKIKKIQDAKLHKLFDYCCGHIKYYQETFKDIDMIQGVEDLVKIPILTKQQIRQRFWDFLPKELPACRVYRTSGSSGIPLCILSDESSRINNSAAIIRYRKVYGMKNVMTPILTPLKKQEDTIPKSHWTYVQGLHKTYYVNPYSEDPRQVDLGIRTLEALRRPAIIGITPAIKALAHQINDGIYPPIIPIAVLTVGESLDVQTQNLLENIFKVRVHDIYACSEAGNVAWQCPQSLSYHVNAENCIMEILDEHQQPVKEGEIGEVVVTNLNRFSMPFIRYKNGDLARASYELCACGRKLPVFKEIIGRSGEDFYLPGGKKMQWNVLKGAMNHNLIRQFQLVQNPDASVTVKYIPEGSAHIPEIKHILKGRFETLLPGSVSISYEVVENIPQSTSGKSKLVVCNYQPSR